MKYKSFLWTLSCIALLTGGCRKSEGDPAPRLPEERVSFVRSYDEAHALALQSIGLLDGVPATRGAAPRTIASGDCVVVPGTRAAGGATDTLLYVFNFADDAGFSIIAADASADPLIAVTEKGHYVYGEPTGVEPFDDYMAQLMSNKPSGPGPDIPLIPDPRPRFYQVEYNTDETVGPLLTTKWGQEGVYGAYCSNGIAGCVATAMAQVLNYHAWPESITLSKDMGNHKRNDIVGLDWVKIRQHQGGFYCWSCEAETHDLISTLLREVGERVDMNYTNPSASGAYYTKAPSAMLSLGYCVPKNWERWPFVTMQKSIRAGNPVLIRGTNSNDGHMWIVDGYVEYKCGVEYYEWVNPESGIVGFDDDIKDLSEGMYMVTSSTVVERNWLHFNWGWDGVCNGYFSQGIYAPEEGEEYDDFYGSISANYGENVMILECYPDHK